MLVLSASSHAVDVTSQAKITGYFTGWSGDVVRVTLEGASYTESNCTTKDGYVTMETENNGYKTHTAALLSAYMSNRPVRIVVDGCTANGRPRIVGVYIEG